MFCRERFIIPKVRDACILELLKDHGEKVNRSILRTILQYETIINYENSGAKQIENLVKEVKQKSIPTSSLKYKDNRKVTPKEILREEVKDENKIDELEEPTSSDSLK